MKFYPLTHKDLSEIYQIETTAYQNPWSYQTMSDTLSNNYLFYGVKKNDILQGFVIAQQACDEMQLLNLCVKPSSQNYGFAKKLLQFITKIAQQNKIRVIFLEVRESNQTAIKLYKNYGFKKIALRKNYYRSNNIKESAIVMSLMI